MMRMGLMLTVGEKGKEKKRKNISLRRTYDEATSKEHRRYAFRIAFLIIPTTSGDTFQ